MHVGEFNVLNDDNIFIGCVQICGCAHTPNLSREPREYPCKFFLATVNFYRFNAKNWQFTVYFAVITQKIGNLL